MKETGQLKWRKCRGTDSERITLEKGSNPCYDTVAEWNERKKVLSVYMNNKFDADIDRQKTAIVQERRYRMLLAGKRHIYIPLEFKKPSRGGGLFATSEIYVRLKERPSVEYVQRLRQISKIAVSA